MNQAEKDSQPPSNNKHIKHKWRAWHEREIPINITGKANKQGINIDITSRAYHQNLSIAYPNHIWQNYRRENKVKLVDNITYIFTAHLPFILKGNIRLQYNTGYPHSYSWANHCFLRHLPSYWYLQGAKRGMGVTPLLKTMINSNAVFSQTKDEPPEFPSTVDEHIILPFTFGKDSFLSYHVAKEIGLKPTLIFFEDPTDEGYEGQHKIKLFDRFAQISSDPFFYIPNPLGCLREKNTGWFGWELAITSWALLCLPFAYKAKAGYIVFSNEKSVNLFFYDTNGFKIATEFEQSDQGVEEISLLTQALSEGEVYTTTFLQGLHDLGILAILKTKYRRQTYPYLMSCWSEMEAGKNQRWCGHCSKCARLFAYLSATGIDPIKEGGFQNNMFSLKKERFYPIFGKTTSATGWDAFAVNTDEMALAYFLCLQRGLKAPLLAKFKKMPLYQQTKRNLPVLIKEYYGLHPEKITPTQWKSKINKIYRKALTEYKQTLTPLLAKQ